MGYITRFDGEIVAKPPITWRELRDTEWIKDDAYPVRIVLEEVEVDTDDGVTISRFGSCIRPSQYDMKGYDFEDQVREIVRRFAFTSSGEQRSFTGVIEGAGEESPDLWRLYVTKDQEVLKVSPELVWPEGTPEL